VALEKPSRGVIYTRKLFNQIEQIALHQARWCNWLTRRPLKAESTGSSPVRAISNHTLEGGCREPPFPLKDVIFRCEWLFWQVLATEDTEKEKGAAAPLCLFIAAIPFSFSVLSVVSVAINSTLLSPTAPARVDERCKTRSPDLRSPRVRCSAIPFARWPKPPDEVA